MRAVGRLSLNPRTGNLLERLAESGRRVAIELRRFLSRARQLRQHKWACHC